MAVHVFTHLACNSAVPNVHMTKLKSLTKCVYTNKDISVS